MSDYIDENDGVPSAPVLEEAAEAVAKPHRGRKPKAAGESSPKRKITIKKRTRVTVRKSRNEEEIPAEDPSTEKESEELQAPAAEVPEIVSVPEEPEAASADSSDASSAIIPEDMAPGVVETQSADAAPESDVEESAESEEAKPAGDRAERDFRSHRDKRMKNGKNIFPEEIEGLIEQLPYVAESLIFTREKHNELVLWCKLVYKADYLEENGLTEAQLAERVSADLKAINDTMPVYKHINHFIGTIADSAHLIGNAKYCLHLLPQLPSKWIGIPVYAIITAIPAFIGI